MQMHPYNVKEIVIARKMRLRHPRGATMIQPTATAQNTVRTGVRVADLKQAFIDNLYYIQARFPAVTTPNDQYMALAYTVRDRLLHRWVRTARTYHEQASRTVCYLSAEYLPGPHLVNNLVNLGLIGQARQAMAELGLDLDNILDQETEPGLGNGGLGRLAACYLDSMATLKIPSVGYGIRYEFGIFEQAIRDGWQVERTDKWLRLGNPWEVPRPELTFSVGFGGSTRARTDATGRYQVEWTPDQVVIGMAYDTPVLGYRVNTANLLRLWQAHACESFDFQSFNAGDYYGAVNAKVVSENLTKVLYPNDEKTQGKVLRLQQQYFFTSCALQDMIRSYLLQSRDLAGLADRYAVQLNDTHPAIAVAELMRLLIDIHGLDWDPAWESTRRMIAYTNHTLLPEALEIWPRDLFGRLLPRHLEIIYEINQRLIDRVRSAYPGDEDRVRRMSLISETGSGGIRMAHLACAGSHAVNGVAELHSRLLREQVLHDFSEFEPSLFLNVTNGVTPRRFLLLSNPRLANLMTGAIGSRWVTDLEQLRALEPLVKDSEFRLEWRKVKRAAKVDLAALVALRTGVVIDPDSMFDIQAKRIHEYKRQHLNILHVIHRYQQLLDGHGAEDPPRTFIFAGKAAPSYAMAKLMIKLVHAVAAVVNADPRVGGRLKVAFLPDFNVRMGQRLYPAGDLSEQISTAGKEASGTGNMKFALNGALTIGTLDGANIEICREVGHDQFFAFGLSAEEVAARQASGYQPTEIWRSNPALRRSLNMIGDGAFSRGDRDLFQPLLENLRYHDPFMVLADHDAYIQCQGEAGRAYADVERWTRSSILTVARMGRFSSDRSIREYCEKVWNAVPVEVDLE